MLYHNSRESEYRSPYGAAEVGSSVHLSITADFAKSVLLRVWTDETKETMYTMNHVSDTNLFEIDLKLPAEPTVLWYFFVVNYDDKTICYGNNRQRLGGIGEVYENEEPQSYQITVYEDYSTPLWYKNAVVYQIFPDRFYRAEDAVAKEALDGKKIEDWTTLPYYIKNDDGSIREWNYWAGNLKGIIEKLPYLAELGVTCIYLNPIFKARSNHRYDTSDYMTIDPMLGTEDDFVLLCNKARNQGIRIILDGVFSHTGIDSKYYNENPSWYTGGFWWGVKDLPEVNENNPEFTEFICGKNGVIRHWLGLGASGFRLDVADELPDEFIENIRKALKEENSNAVLIGEVWEDASNKISYGHRRKFIHGRQLDGAMNYPLREDIIAFLNYEINAYEFAERINARMENYPAEAFYANFNLIGSHDRERILSVFDENQDKLKVAAMLSFVLPGAPVIYYGDDTGVTGGTDPDNRRTFPWNNRNEELEEFYKVLIREYKRSPELMSGDLSIYAVNDDEISIIRSLGNKLRKIKVNRDALTCNL